MANRTTNDPFANKLRLTLADKVMEASTLLILLFIWISAIYGYIKNPYVIPTHVTFNGESDRYGNKEELLILPIIATILFLFFGLLSRYPIIPGTRFPSKKEPSIKKYRLAALFYRTFNLLLVSVLFVSFIIFLRLIL